ncbi:MAG: DNA gyrase C-terminal beta-propeller domain-containing protein, partial [Candidatus Limisoma sp.]|nr:DNA gyrase C-terminal beta-propeller domain-containing protein [Candidatus Limisoma sp.]
MHIIKAPDFPTGGTIYGYAGVKEAYETGRGRIVVRAKAEVESENDRDVIVVTEIPYCVNKSELIKNIADLVGEKKIEGINDIADHSDRRGIRIVIELKKDANASVVLNKLYKMTALQSSFSVNNVALVGGRPKLLNLKEIIEEFVKHRHEVVIRRSRFQLKKAEERAHIVNGLIIACDNIDEVVKIIRSSRTTDEARQRLAERFDLSDIQTRAIVDMRLSALVNMNQEKLHLELEELMHTIEYLNSVLNDPEVCRQLIESELVETRDKYGDERRTEIVYASEEFNAEDFYADDEMIITISHLGYIKRTPLSEFRAQGRGGVGVKGSDTRDEDFIEHIYTATMHNYMLFFTQQGRCYWLKVYDIPEGTRTSKGRAIQNLLNIDSDDKVKAFINVKRLGDADFVKSHYLMFCTKKGVVKKTCLEAYSRPRQNGVNAIIIREGDELLQVRMTNGREEVLLANRNGRAIRFNESTVRDMGRMSAGVKGMTLDGGDDEVVGMITMTEDTQKTVMVVSEKGRGKRSNLEDYRITNRGGKGVKTITITEKTGRLVDIKDVDDSKDLMIINKSGITIRLHVADINVYGRAAQGVKLIDLEKRNDEIVSVCVVDSNEEDAVEESLTEPSVTPVETAADAPVEEDAEDNNLNE